MAKLIPTTCGDVLILKTASTYTVYAVAEVRKNGQQDFQRETGVKHFNDMAGALTMAKQLVGMGRRIFVRDIDTNEWSEIKPSMPRKSDG